jgi:hypothetical protein
VLFAYNSAVTDMKIGKKIVEQFGNLQKLIEDYTIAKGMP